MTIQSMPLTPSQRERMSSDSDWLQLTPEQERFIGDAEKGHACLFYGDDIIRAPGDLIAEALASAFKQATNAALGELRMSANADFDVACDPPSPGQMFLRVTVTSETGANASAIGMIPDPRSN